MRRSINSPRKRVFIIALLLAGVACRANPAGTPAPDPGPVNTGQEPQATPAPLTVVVWVEHEYVPAGDLQTVYVKAIDAQLAPVAGAQVHAEISNPDYGVQSLALPDTNADGESHFSGTVGQFRSGSVFKVVVTITAGEASATGSTSYTLWP